MEAKKLIIFDFDGVLADTLESNFKIHKDVNGNLTWERYQEFGEGDFHKGMEKAVKEDAHIIPPNFYELYEKNLHVITIHDIIRNAITELKDEYILSIVSSTSTSYISDFLKKEGVWDYFSDILGVDVHRSKVEKINTILKKHNILPKDVVFITDTLGDILEGNECGVKSIGVTWGLHEKETLQKGNPVAIIEDPRDLVASIENVLK